MWKGVGGVFDWGEGCRGVGWVGRDIGIIVF